MQFTCTQCGTKFSHRNSLLRHFTARHKGGDKEKFTCVDCGKNFSTKSNLKQHSSRKHSSRPIERERLTCAECGKSFSTKYNLNQHSITRHSSWERERFTCAECGKSFSTKSNLNKHSITQHSSWERERFTYAECGKSFSTKSNLKHHSSTQHSGPQPSTSTPPPESSSSSLPQPTPSTSGQCPPPPPPSTSPPPMYRCAICGKSYMWMKSLRFHVRSSHYTIRSESCSFCGETFAKTGDLTRHLISACPAIKGSLAIETQILNKSSTRSTTSVPRTTSTNDLDMTMSGASTSTFVPSFPPHPCNNDQPMIPPDLPARVQRWMDEESLNEGVSDKSPPLQMSESSSSGSLCDDDDTPENQAVDSSCGSPTKD